MANHRLPPLKSLVAFEAAGRHLSFTRAAMELNVTQGAVSRHIAQLEDFLGCDLFERKNRQVFLTATGIQYYKSVKQALGMISTTTARLLARRPQGQITLVTSTALASLWLLPRIASFRKTHDQIDIRILVRDDIGSLDTIEFDLAVFYCQQVPASFRTTRLFEEQVICVCSPEYLKRYHDPGDPNRILRSTRLCCDIPGSWVQWSDWFDFMGVDESGARSSLDINNHTMVLQAAIDGQGIALAWKGLVDVHLNSNELVFAVESVMKTGCGFYLLEPGYPVETVPPLVPLKQWLTEAQ